MPYTVGLIGYAPPSLRKRKIAILESQYEDRRSLDLLAAWNEGYGDVDSTERCADKLKYAMYRDEDVARIHFDAVYEVAQGTMPVPTAHMILHDCYRRGWAVAESPAKAVHHLEMAIKCGDESALWFMGCYLQGDEKLSSVLGQDLNRALEIFRELAINSNDVSIVSLARGSAAGLIARNYSYYEVSATDRKLVDMYVSDWQTIRSMDYLYLALFYASAASGDDYAGPEYRKARELLIKGTESGIEKVRNECQAQLIEWNVLPVNLPDPEPTTAEKAVQAVKVTAVAGGISMIVIFWSIFGLFLLAVVTMINATMLPIILGIGAVCYVVSLFRR
jgi:TPR repeat protein